jgi:asparagine synthase (glutamine-hydrolysing)
MGGALWMESGASHGLDVRDPTRDRRLVEFCWRLPDTAFWANGRKRGLIRRGMQAHLPAPVLFCKAKGLQSADVLARYRLEAASLEKVLEAAGGQPMANCLDFGRMQKDMNSIKAGNETNLINLHAFGRSVQIALFLNQF